MIHALYCNAINRETRPTAFYSRNSKTETMPLPALLFRWKSRRAFWISVHWYGCLWLSGQILLQKVFYLNLLAIACLYYWYMYLYIYQYQYLYLPLWSMTLCPPVRVRTWKKRFSHQTHLHACPLFKIKSNIEPHFNLQSSKQVKIKN